MELLHADGRAAVGAQYLLGAPHLLLQLGHGLGVAQHVIHLQLVLVRKRLGKVLAQQRVQLVRTQVSVPVNILDLQLGDGLGLARLLDVVAAVAHQRHQRGARAHVVQDDVLRLVGKVALDAKLERGGCVRVDQPHDVDAHQIGGINQSLPLRLTKISWHCDDCIRHWRARLRLSD
mmetsp:Transcript_27424/g.69746  ORF Transcript_27424/g.69746 Transcript_27424/m.69746 type:complete len:176 (+) Transcript_27424:2639-3166(+)